LSAADRDLFLMGQVEVLKKSFTGSAAGIVGRTVEVRMLQDAGWKAVLLSQDVEAPEGAVRAGEWTDVVAALEQ
jgi:hypothetical protein